MDLSNFASKSSTVEKKSLCLWLTTETSPQPVKKKKGVSPWVISFLAESSTTAALGLYSLIDHLRLTAENHNDSAHVVNADIYHVTN